MKVFATAAATALAALVLAAGASADDTYPPPTVTITNPVTGLIYAVGMGVNVAASYQDLNPRSVPATCTINWGDGTSSPGYVVDGAIGHCYGSRPGGYQLPGFYNITATVADGLSSGQSAPVTVYVMSVGTKKRG
jgi:hypothetical protein